MKIINALLLLGLIATPVAYADSASEANAQASAATATNGANDEEPVPEIRVIKRGSNKVQEYRINGRLYMVKITPAKGKPYYLVDQTGDGLMVRRSDPLAPQAVPQWVIMKF